MGNVASASQGLMSLKMLTKIRQAMLNTITAALYRTDCMARSVRMDLSLYGSRTRKRTPVIRPRMYARAPARSC